MTSEAGDSEERRWLLQPPAPGETEFIFRMGDAAGITPEVRQALDQLMRALGTDEVRGYQDCGAFHTRPCDAFSTCTGLDPNCPGYTIQCQIAPCLIRCQAFI